MHTFNNEASHGLCVGEIELHDCCVHRGVLLVKLSLDLVPICGRLDLFQKGKGLFFPSKRGLGADPAPAALISVSGDAGREPARH